MTHKVWHIKYMTFFMTHKVYDFFPRVRRPACRHTLKKNKKTQKQKNKGNPKPSYSLMYETFSYKKKCYVPSIHQIENLRFLSISWYKFKRRLWLNLNLYWEILVFRFGGFRGSHFSVETIMFYFSLCEKWDRVAVCAHRDAVCWWNYHVLFLIMSRNATQHVR